MNVHYADGTVTVLHGDCRVELADLEPDSIDACVTDPPYELAFMGAKWDGSGVAFDPATWQAIYRVLKPGAHLIVFGAPRTWHRVAVAVEDAGFEIRDTILAWANGEGFPKSLNVSKAIDKAAGAEREVVGTKMGLPGYTLSPNADSAVAAFGDGFSTKTAEQRARESAVTAPATAAAAQWDGWGTALKPAIEPILLARKPLIGTVVSNVLAHGTGAMNIDACRIAAGGDSLGGGANTAMTSDTRQAGWTRPWMDDDDASAAAAERSRASTARAEELGRWPANLVLVHVERVYYHLRDDLPDDLIQAVHAYYRSFQAVPEVRWPDHGDAVGTSETKVLFEEVPGGAPERGAPRHPDDRVGDSDVPGVRQPVRGDAGLGEERASEVLHEPLPPQGGEAREASAWEGAQRPVQSQDVAGGDGAAGQGTVIAVEGRELPRLGRLPVGDDRPAAGDDSGARAADGAAGQEVRAGAPGRDGGVVGSAVDEGGACAPSERGEGGQRTDEPVAERSGEAQHGASRGRETAGRSGSGERGAEGRGGTLVVGEHLIPPGWMPFFHRRFTEGCRPTDTVIDVPTTTHYPAARGAGGIGQDGHKGQDGLTERTPGTEAVVEWACAEGCPVAALDAQSLAGGMHSAGHARAAIGKAEAKGMWSKGSGGGGRTIGGDGHRLGDSGGASRFYARFGHAIDEQIMTDGPIRYVAKASQRERPEYVDDDGAAVQHSTVKPLSLVQYLVKLVTPPGGIVLDPFVGSGTTPEAAVLEGMRFVGCELTSEYLPLIDQRIARGYRGGPAYPDPVPAPPKADTTTPTLFDDL